MTTHVRIKSVQFTNYKSLRDFQMSLRKLNILVGPNNCGKSTVLSAFRILVAAIAKARARKPVPLTYNGRSVLGYHLVEGDIAVSLENVHTDLKDIDSQIRYTLSNGEVLVVDFPGDGGSRFLVPDLPPRNPTEFKARVPITVAQIPVLGPVEHEEPLLQEATVKAALGTHRASRHFRNYWHHFPEDFDRFAEYLRKTWRVMNIEPPEVMGLGTDMRLVMYATEERQTRELFWAGFGFQVWCQLLTHITRASEATVLVVDEPEIYLHPDLQRSLVHILEAAGPDIVMATHSTEIITEAEPQNICIINPKARSARRIRRAAEVQDAFDVLGSRQNVTLSQLSRDRCVIFVEGQDFRILRQFARRLGYDDVANGLGFAVVPIGGFSSWARLDAMKLAFEQALGEAVRLAVVLDRDYRCDEEIETIRAELERHMTFVHIHDRKELENYLLVPNVLAKALRRASSERARRSGVTADLDDLPRMDRLLNTLSDSLRGAVGGQYIGRYLGFKRSSGRDDATLATEITDWTGAKWADLESRMCITPGKDVLALLNREIQPMIKVSLTPSKIIDAFSVDEIPDSIKRLVAAIEQFRRK